MLKVLHKGMSTEDLYRYSILRGPRSPSTHTNRKVLGPDIHTIWVLGPLGLQLMSEHPYYSFGDLIP